MVLGIGAEMFFFFNNFFFFFWLFIIVMSIIVNVLPIWANGCAHLGKVTCPFGRMVICLFGQMTVKDMGVVSCHCLWVYGVPGGAILAVVM